MLTHDAILGLDVGTTSTKAVLFDLAGAELATAEHPYRLHTPQPGWVELDPEDLWQAMIQVLQSIVAAAGQRYRIQALALATQSGSLVPARADGTPVYPVITWLDVRTQALVEEWKAQGLESLVKSTSGWHLYPSLNLATIAWLHQHLPGVSDAAERYLWVNDYLVHRLTGRFCTNPSNASGTGLLDITSGQWSPELCTMAGIAPGQLSPVHPGGEVIGEITAEVSRLTRLPAGTQVVNGGHDQGCTALGLGVTSPGKVLLACGTSWVLTGVVDTPDVDAVPSGLNMHFHPAPGCWTVSQSIGGLGASLEWLLNQCWRSADAQSPAARAEIFASLDAELHQTAPGGDGLFFLPFAGGQRAPSGEQGGGFLGLRLDHTRADMARAVMEGAAFELRWALPDIQQAGMPIDQMWMIGGAARSPIWPGIVADGAGVPLTLPSNEQWAAVGAAMLAGVGIGAFENLETAQVRFQKPARRIEPDGTRRRIYNSCFARYQRAMTIAQQVKRRSE
jgi:xylulokinase